MTKSTFFAPADRLSVDVVNAQAAILTEIPSARSILDACPIPAAIVNGHRQIVFSNPALAALIGDGGHVSIGQRLGEVLNCIHSKELPGGCGTSESCRNCGAAWAQLEAIAGRSDAQECRISTHKGGETESMDLKISAFPFPAAGEQFVLLHAVDISHEKRRRALERVFFHDILNTAGNVHGFVSLLKDSVPPGEAKELVGLASLGVDELVSEISSQRQLTAAENKDLVVSPDAIDALNLVHELALVFQHRREAKVLSVVVASDSADLQIVCDRALLARVLGNMLKNAVEASPPGDVVTIGCYDFAHEVQFEVHNAAVMSNEVQLQVFQRSFSTKGSGRGLGTYGMKLLGEYYLDGQISFRSERGEGTTFTARLPKHLQTRIHRGSL